MFLGVRVIFSVIFAAVAYDIAKNDGFYRSQTYQSLKNVGVTEHGKAFYKMMEKTFNDTSIWAEKNYPLMYNQASSLLKPYTDLLYNLSLILNNVALGLMQNAVKIVDTGVQNSLLLLSGDTLDYAKKSLDIITLTLKNIMESATLYANNLLKS